MLPGDEARWDAFVEASDGGTFYHLTGWKHLIERKLGHKAYYLMCEQGGQIYSVLPVVHVKSLLFGNALISIPFLVYGGPVSIDSHAEKLLLDEARKLGESLGVDYVELRTQKPLQGDWIVNKSHVTFKKKLDAEPERNLALVPRKQRAMIRKGIKEGLQAEMDDDVHRLYDAMLVCKRNLGTPFFSRSWLSAIKSQFSENVEILTVTHQDQTVCSVMSFKFRGEILPYYGGGGDLARHLKGNDFMYWSVMEKACRDGLHTFDYGRSMIDSGAYRFKKHWGFEPTPLYNQYYLVRAEAVPELSPANSKYQLAIRAWRSLPLWAAASIGPFLARRLG